MKVFALFSIIFVLVIGIGGAVVYIVETREPAVPWTSAMCRSAAALSLVIALSVTVVQSVRARWAAAALVAALGAILILLFICGYLGFAWAARAFTL